jgi:hypothetical protein
MRVPYHRRGKVSFIISLHFGIQLTFSNTFVKFDFEVNNCVCHKHGSFHCTDSDVSFVSGK